MSHLKCIVLNFLLFSGAVALGQTTNCSEVLTKAQDTYKEGRISEIADLLAPCLETGLSKAEKVEAYRLLTLTNLYFNEKGKAQTSLISLLKNDPEYKIRQGDPTEFVNLFNSFRTTPVLLIGVKIGINFLDIDVKKNFSLDNSAIQRGKYASNLGAQGGLTVHIPLKKKLSLITELLYATHNYTYTDRLFDYAALEFPEKQVYLGLPVLLNYNFGKSEKWIPYFNLGGSVSYLMKSKAEPVRVDETDGNNQREIKEGEIVISSNRKKINYNIVAGAGLKVKDILGRGYLFVDVRYTHGLNNVVKEEERYTNEDLMYKYLYVDNNFKMNSFQYSIGYTYPLYKPKLKRVKKEKKENKKINKKTGVGFR